MKKIIDFDPKVVKKLTEQGKKRGIKKFKNYIEWMSRQLADGKLVEQSQEN